MKTTIRRTSLIAGVAICALAMTATTPAFASSDADPDAVAAAVAAVAPTELEVLQVEQVDDRLTTSFANGGTAAVSIDPVDGLRFASEGGEGASVTLPGSQQLSDAVVADDGSVTFAGDANVPSVNVLTAEDAVRVSTVITSASQPEKFDYDFGSGATVEVQSDGSALVLSNEKIVDAPGAEKIIAVIGSPWATDATGVPVETYYVADAGVLTQIVKHQTAELTYPVVADPSFDQPNVIQHRIRFNRAETASIASGGWGGVIGSFTCGAMAPVCALATGTLAYQAGIAQNSKPKKCVQVTATQPIVVPGIVWWVDTYSGGPCK